MLSFSLLYFLERVLTMKQQMKILTSRRVRGMRSKTVRCKKKKGRGVDKSFFNGDNRLQQDISTHTRIQRDRPLNNSRILFISSEKRRSTEEQPPGYGL